MLNAKAFICALTCAAIAGSAAPAVLASEADIPSCAAATTTNILQEIKDHIGLPETHKDHQDPPDVALICHDRFCTQLNGATKQPDWVVERLTPDIVTGDNTRPKIGFKPDPKRPANVPTARDADYRSSGFARGHQAASADFKCKLEWMKQTFVFSNAVPQIQNGFNGGIWKQLEEHVQNLAKERDEIFVITGPIDLGDDGAETVIDTSQNACGRRIVLAGLSKLGKASVCDANDKDASQKCDQGVAVPAGLFKIIYVPRSGRTFGFLMSNEDHRKIKKRSVDATAYLEEWRASIAAIEESSNLRFFTNLSLRASRVRKEHCTETRWR